MHIMDVYPIASTSQIKKLIGVPVGVAPEKKKVQKKVNYPQNLLTALKVDIKNPGSIIFFVGLTLPRYSFSKPSASLDRNLRQCLW